MGFFKSLTKLFRNAIECPDKFADRLFYVAPLKRRTIKLGANLFVRENFVAIVSVKHKVADLFVAGKHKLTLGAMPTVSKYVSFKVRKKDQKPKDKFKGEIYFINLKAFEGEFTSVDSFILKDPKLGRVKVRANGKFLYQIKDAKKFLEACFLNWAYLKPERVTKKINLWMTEDVIKNLEHMNPPLLDFAKNEPYLSEKCSEAVDKKFLSLGLFISGLLITETFVPSKVVSKLDDELGADVDVATPTETTMDSNNQVEYFKTDRLNEYETDEYSYVANGYEYGEGSKNLTMQRSEYGHTLVEDEPFYVENKHKRCPHCNASIGLDAQACYNCGNKQIKKRTCKNCNFEVEEGEFVCPNCRSIVI